MLLEAVEQVFHHQILFRLKTSSTKRGRMDFSQKLGNLTKFVNQKPRSKAKTKKDSTHDELVIKHEVKLVEEDTNDATSQINSEEEQPKPTVQIAVKAGQRTGRIESYKMSHQQLFGTRYDRYSKDIQSVESIAYEETGIF